MKLVSKGNFKKTFSFLNKKRDYVSILEKYGEIGVQFLAKNTPIDTGKTASSWSYEVVKNQNGYAIQWNNSNINNNVKIALLLQYGHGTNGGGYVTGIDYINPALLPVFRNMADELWKEVCNK